MICERLLALMRKSAPLRCYIERLLASGFLTQVLAAHTKAGGADVRKVTRSQLLKLGARLRCAKKASKQVAFNKFIMKS